MTNLWVSDGVSPGVILKKLGFERKARLFCDVKFFYFPINKNLLGFERKARLFCDFFFPVKTSLTKTVLGFERKARLFCDGYRDQKVSL